jgi:DNA-directed RNA polymerase subunit RPC12/RpoP
VTLNWTKDRNRELAKRAAADELEDCRLLGPVPSDSTIGMKASLRALAANIDLDEILFRNNDPRGSWKIVCQKCSEEFIAWGVISTALEAQIICPICSYPHWLSEGDIEIPWD